MGSTVSANDYLDSFLDSRCSSPRDYIYAFYNLYSEEIRNNIEVNVKKDLIEIVCQAAKAITKETGSLRIMTFRGRQSRPVDLWQYKLPSWCPFFGVEYLSDSISPKPWEDPIRSRKDNEIATFLEDGKLMEVKGSIMGHISCMVFKTPPALRPFENIDFDDERRIKTEWYFARECMYLVMSVLADQNDNDGLPNISQDVPGGEIFLAVIVVPYSLLID
ncbi:uncharacterized protein BO88DRAFT_475894 [Aspergillus vadensis CBS 113365]|uniref:Uncharacterized protein n=1 Tax=Aspergillus vadensis (strain CBS 113365 / IMI 142717 / IBT 24658) TaxID=1448311 RepID=A0A319B0M9_ASPVC|nr:hypothetical protein BO88DRAFT_475894 [Aspergillus vadensis CBS 113365]PYH63710.1 hypothetical protein BO88DRAFT_475894 [Aspergillus vadensis CBS 113365]